MALFKEIVTKAVIGKGKKIFKEHEPNGKKMTDYIVEMLK